MKELDQILRRARSALATRKANGSSVHISYAGKTSWMVEAYVGAWAPRGRYCLEVIGSGSSLEGAYEAFLSALNQAHTQYLGRLERAERKRR